MAAVHDRFVGRMLDHYRSDPTVREVDGAADLFRYLGSRNVRVGLDTGFDRPTAAAILARLGWGPGRVGRRDRPRPMRSPAGRPAPDMIRRLMGLTGVAAAARVVKVGDTPGRPVGGGPTPGAGLVVGVTEGSHTADELRPHPHHRLIPTVRQLPGVLSDGR